LTLDTTHSTQHTTHYTLQEWVSSTSGENGEQVTEKGKKIGEKTKVVEEENDEKNDAE
jgi:hypothetical protein